MTVEEILATRVHCELLQPSEGDPVLKNLTLSVNAETAHFVQGVLEAEEAARREMESKRIFG